MQRLDTAENKQEVTCRILREVYNFHRPPRAPLALIYNGTSVVTLTAIGHESTAQPLKRYLHYLRLFNIELTVIDRCGVNNPRRGFYFGFKHLFGATRIDIYSNQFSNSII